jgi:hypothetical protein
VSINPVNSSSSATAALTRAANHAAMIGNGHYGSLSRSDIALIKKATGQEFEWPPQEGKLVPRAAFDLAAERERQMAAGSIIGDLTSKDLADLKRRGILEAGFVDAALQALSHGTSNASEDSTGRNGPAPSKPAVAHEGELYL